MISTTDNLELMQISSNLLELVYEAQKGELDMPTGDLQGVIEAQVMKAYLVGKNSLERKI